MRATLAFIKKEITDQLRSGILFITVAIFVLFGIMNPVIAKLTPWMLDLMSDSLAEAGMEISLPPMSAMDSWAQYFSNVPMALIAFVLLEGSIFTKEYGSGTLIMSLTKGLERYKVALAKISMLVAVWTVGYWMCFGITYGYNEYFWDNSVAQELMLSVVCLYIFGLFVISLAVLFSMIFSSNTGVFLGTGGVVLVSSLLGMISKISKYLPTFLMDGYSLVYGINEAKDYIWAIAITASATLVCFVVSIPLFNKKQF